MASSASSPHHTRAPSISCRWPACTWGARLHVVDVRVLWACGGLVGAGKAPHPLAVQSSPHPPRAPSIPCTPNPPRRAPSPSPSPDGSALVSKKSLGCSLGPLGSCHGFESLMSMLPMASAGGGGGVEPLMSMLPMAFARGVVGVEAPHRSLFCSQPPWAGGRCTAEADRALLSGWRGCTSHGSCLQDEMVGLLYVEARMRFLVKAFLLLSEHQARAAALAPTPPCSQACEQVVPAMTPTCL